MVCFTYLLGIVGGALAVNDLNFIFGMIAAFNESNLNFVFPGVFFLKAAFYTGNKQTWVKTSAGVFAIIGVFYFFVSNYFNIIKVVND
jgi:hypothetical protein